MHFKFLISALALQENDINSERTCLEVNFTSADKDDNHVKEQVPFPYYQGVNKQDQQPG
jgi:hypothetical protein